MARWLAIVLLAATIGCGRLRFDPVRVDAGESDAGCALGSFGPPVRIASLASSFDDYGPSLSADGLAIYFQHDLAPSTSDPLVAIRPDQGSAFGAPSPLTAIDGSGRDSELSISQDGLALYFESNRDGNPAIFEITRPTDPGTWSAPRHLTVLDVVTGNGGPDISADGLSIVFDDEEVESRLWIATRADATSDAWSVAQLPDFVPGVDEGYPCLSPDGLELFFTVRGATGVDLDIWVARRESTASPFTTAVPVAELTTDFGESDPDLAYDGRQLFFSSNRAPSDGWDLWMAERDCR